MNSNKDIEQASEAIGSLLDFPADYPKIRVVGHIINTMTQSDRKCFVSDDDSHWYCIPVSLKREFFRMSDEMAKDPPFSDLIFEQFDEKFSSMRLNMHISNYSFIDMEEVEHGN